MADFELSVALQDIGVPEDVAQDLETALDGRDLVDLVNALNTNNIGSGISHAAKILAKYGISIQEDADMDHKSYLNALLASASRGGRAEVAVESFIGEWLKPISESNDPVSPLLALEGYNYCTSVGENSDSLIDWLEENQVDYQTDGTGNFQIRCADRESAYRVGGALNKIMGKVVERVAVAEASDEDETMSESKHKAGQKVVKDHNVSKFAAAKLSKVSGGAHNSEIRKAVDSPLDRKAKHKGKAFESIREDLDGVGDDLEETIVQEFSIGDNVRVGEHTGTIKIPHGPNGTVGVLCNGVLEMVEAADVSRLDEGVLGMTSIAPLFRLRELAGLPPTEMTPEVPLAKVPAPMDDFSAEPDMGAEPAIGMGSDEFADDGMGGDDFGDLGGGDMGSLDADPLEPNAGMPGAIGSDPLQTAGVAPIQSDAYSTIEDHLNNIQTMLGDIKLSEYKGLVKKLEDLAGQVRLMGRDYLGERRKK